MPGSASSPHATQLGSASPQTQRFVEVAAELEHFDVRRVASIMHRTVAELLPSVHEALDVGILVEDGQQLAFKDDAGGTAARPSFGWESLTAAELRVARLAAEALTNQQIAARLELSRHTVESHLRHSYRKLDIRSRVELTRLVVIHEPAG